MTLKLNELLRLVIIVIHTADFTNLGRARWAAEANSHTYLEKAREIADKNHILSAFIGDEHLDKAYIIIKFAINGASHKKLLNHKSAAAGVVTGPLQPAGALGSRGTNEIKIVPSL